MTKYHCFVLLCLSLWLLSVEGTTYSVTPGETTAWFSHLSDLQPGDTVVFHPQTAGTPYTYSITQNNAWTLSGTVSGTITVQGADGEAITIQQTSGSHNVMEVSGSYFVIKNLILTSNQDGVIGLRLMPDVSNALIDSVTVHDIKANGITANTPNGKYNNVTFSNCEVYNTGETGECFYVGCQPSGGNTATIECEFTNGLFINNYCHDTCKPNGCSGGSIGSGYQVKGWGSHSNVLRRNVCKNVNQVCMLLYDDFDLGPNIVEENYIYGSVNDAGIQVSAGAKIINNVIVGNQGGGIVVTSNPVNLYPQKLNRNIVIQGNTLVNNNGVGISVPTLSPTSGSLIQNNAVFEDSTGNAFSGADQTGVTWANNAYHGGSLPAGTTSSAGFQVGTSTTELNNPTSGNYHPKAGSALLAAGNDLASSVAPYDFDFNTRDACTPTVGAYETTSGGALSLAALPSAPGSATPCGAYGEISCSASCSSTTTAGTTKSTEASTTTKSSESTTSTIATSTSTKSTTTQTTSSASNIASSILLSVFFSAMVALIRFF